MSSVLDTPICFSLTAQNPGPVPFCSILITVPHGLASNELAIHSPGDTVHCVYPREIHLVPLNNKGTQGACLHPERSFESRKLQQMGSCPPSIHPLPLAHTLPSLSPSLTTSSAKRTLSSSGFGMGPENSRNCRGWLSRMLISGRSLPPKQHRKPRPWRLLLRGAMVTAGRGVSRQVP